MAERRHFLFLQGQPGDFFARLAVELKASGCLVSRVNFNGGDQIDWKSTGAIAYRGRQQAWPTFLARLIRQRAVTDLVLFGDCRPMHRVARATAAGLGIAVHVFEEGYIRPDWITLERGGVNGFSPLPVDPDWYRAEAEGLPPIGELPLLPSSLRERTAATLRYYAAAILLFWAYPFYRTHRPWPALVEASGWVRRLLRRSRAQEPRIEELGESRYFVLPLQLDSDVQLRDHSDFDGMQPALSEVLASFAGHAPEGVRLLVKLHPLDNGLIDWRRQTLDYARALGVEGRLLFVEGGDIEAMVRRSEGVVTVNSTTGALALRAQRPVITLGRAVYDMPGLTHQGSLHSFWTAPQQPDRDLYDAFQRVLVQHCLLRGGFYRDDPERPLAEAAASRMLKAPIARTMPSVRRTRAGFATLSVAS